MFAGGFASLYVGAYAYSNSDGGASTVSIIGPTSITAGSSVSVTGNEVSGCSANVSNTLTAASGSNAYGGAISTYVGVYAYATTFGGPAQIDVPGDTIVSDDVAILISQNQFSNVQALAVLNVTTGSFGSSSYG